MRSGRRGGVARVGRSGARVCFAAVRAARGGGAAVCGALARERRLRLCSTAAARAGLCGDVHAYHRRERRAAANSALHVHDAQGLFLRTAFVVL